MRETFSIRTVDVDRLDDAINYQCCKTGKTDLYIFMNRRTFGSLYEKIEKHNLNTLDMHRAQSPLALYMGLKVFEDNTLEYGEIEIR